LRPLVESVPNFSEGRRPEVIQAIVESLRRAGGVHILDLHTDPDHNRSVVTLVGLPSEVEKALFAGIQTAVTLIDLTEHRGVHPRFGAADVVPFIPIRDVSMAECVDMAHRLGRRLAMELGLPVYFYEQAALRPEHRDLAAIRKPSFQYEHLREAIQTDPRWMPDYGPAELGTAGAVLVGARPPLIAYNVYLNTSEVEIARKIARALRHSDGGLRYVKASGFLVNGRAQVSMNLTDFRRTPIFRVMELLKREADRYGVRVVASELVGLIPQDALLESAAWYLHLDNFSPQSLLETRILQAETGDTPLGLDESPPPEDASRKIVLPTLDAPHRPQAFSDAVAAGSATPGGGASAALVGSLAASLGEMAASLTLGKRGYADVENSMLEAQNTCHRLRFALLDAIQEDIEAVQNLMDGLKAHKNEAAAEILHQAALRSAQVPLQVARLCLETLTWLSETATLGNHNAVIDVAVGAHLALAALEGSLLNMRVNLLALADLPLVQGFMEEGRQILAKARPLSAQIIALACQRAGLEAEEV